MRFGIRFLFVLVLVFAAFFAVARTAGYVVAGGTVVCLCAVAWAILWRRRGAFMFLRIGVIAAASVVIWFLAVEWSWFVADCPDCGHGRDVGQYRVFGITVTTEVRDSPTALELILNDLGVPCEHQNTEPWHKYRFWGLVYPAFPAISGTVRIGGDNDLYTDETARKVRRLGKENPQLAVQLYDRAIRDHDYTGFWKTFEELTDEPPDNKACPQSPASMPERLR